MDKLVGLMSAISDKHLLPGQFYGNVVNKRSCGGLVLSELKHTTPKKLAEHSHQLANFCLLIKGGYREFFGSRFIEYRPLTIMFHPPELTHRDEIGNRGGHFFNVELDAHWMEHLDEYVKSLKINFACQELFKPNGDLASVALAAGFADRSHFTRVFKQVTGMTPGAFRAATTNRPS